MKRPALSAQRSCSEAEPCIEHAALRRGTFEPLCANDETNVYAFGRRLGQEMLLVVLNNGESPYEVDLSVDGVLPESTRLVDLLSGADYEVRLGTVRGSAIARRSGAVLEAVQQS